MDNIPVKVFEAKIEDECGGVWPKAIVAILDFSELCQTTGSATSFKGEYSLSHDVHGISYKVSYYYDQSKMDQGKRSRPLMHDVYIEPEIIFEKNDNGEYVRDDNGEKIPTKEMTEGRYVLSDTFKVDDNHPDIRQVLESDLGFESKMLRAIKMDISIRFADK